MPRAQAELPLLARDALPLWPERCELGGRKLAESVKRFDAGKGVDADQIARGFGLSRERGENLDELKLIIKIVLEPEHNLSRSPQRGIPRAKFVQQLRQRCAI